MGMSRRAYAAHRGVSHTAVGKAVATGRISTLPDGSIDPDVADREWNANTDPTQQRGAHARAMGVATAAETRAAAPPAGTKPVPAAALQAVDDTLREAGVASGGGASAGTDAGDAGEGGGEVSFLRARMANEVLKAQTAKVRLQKLKGELVDRARATSYVFDLARRERDAWMNWPPRVAANMAADLGVDPHQLEQVLDKYLRTQLAELAEVKVELR